VNGSPFIAAEYQGATYYFATEEEHKLCSRQSDKYAPQCGGVLRVWSWPWQVVPRGHHTWQVRTGKLYLT